MRDRKTQRAIRSPRDRVDDAVAAGVPFTLACYTCDARLDTSPPDADLLGWTTLFYDEHGLSWNFLGTCPECQAAEEGFDGPNP